MEAKISGASERLLLGMCIGCDVLEKYEDVVVGRCGLGVVGWTRDVVGAVGRRQRVGAAMCVR